MTTYFDSIPIGTIPDDEVGPPEKIYSNAVPVYPFGDFTSNRLDIKCKSVCWLENFTHSLSVQERMCYSIKMLTDCYTKAYFSSNIVID